jgi:hypothetical protein
MPYSALVIAVFAPLVIGILTIAVLVRGGRGRY